MRNGLGPVADEFMQEGSFGFRVFLWWKKPLRVKLQIPYYFVSIHRQDTQSKAAVQGMELVEIVVGPADSIFRAGKPHNLQDLGLSGRPTRKHGLAGAGFYPVGGHIQVGLDAQA